MADVKVIVVAVLLVLVVAVVLCWDFIKALWAEKPLLIAPEEVADMHQYCARDAQGKYHFLFAKDDLVGDETVAKLYVAMEQDGLGHLSNVTETKEVTVQRSATSLNDLEYKLSEAGSFTTVSRFGCPGNFTRFDFARGSGKEFKLNENVYALNMTEVKVKITDKEEVRQKVALQLKNADEKFTELKSCWVHTAETTGTDGKKTQQTIVSQETSTTNDCNLFEGIWGLSLTAVELVKKELKFKGSAIKAANGAFTETLCSSKLSIFPTHEGFRVMYTDKDEFTRFYPAVLNFPSGENFVDIDTKDLKIKVTASLTSTKINAQVTADSKTESIVLRAGSCMMETAEMTTLLNFASTLPEAQCTTGAELKYRSLITRENKDKNDKKKVQKVLSVMGVNLATMKLKIDDETEISLREVNGKQLFVNKVTGAVKCGEQQTPKIST